MVLTQMEIDSKRREMKISLDKSENRDRDSKREIETETLSRINKERGPKLGWGRGAP